jgi:hypothetical protein
MTSCLPRWKPQQLRQQGLNFEICLSPDGLKSRNSGVRQQSNLTGLRLTLQYKTKIERRGSKDGVHRLEHSEGKMLVLKVTQSDSEPEIMRHATGVICYIRDHVHHTH